MKQIIAIPLIVLSILISLIVYIINPEYIPIPLFLLSLSILIFAADIFVDKAAKIGKSLGLSDYLIGVFLIGFGTSTPELVTSVLASFKGDFEIAYFNVVGSNIGNILFILGITFLFIKGSKIVIQTNLLKTESLYLFASAIIPILLFITSSTHSLAGIWPVAIFLVYLYINIKYQDNNDGKVSASYVDYILFIVGLLIIIVSSDYTITYLKQTSQILKIGVDVISVLALALGTSIPELVSSIILIRKSSDNIDMVVGNIIGSNIFNTLMILGLAMISSYVGGHEMVELNSNIVNQSWLFLIVSTFTLILIYLDKEIYKEDGAILLLFYMIFLTMVI